MSGAKRESLKLAYPFEGSFRLTQGFGARPEFYKRWDLKGHNGLDFGLPEGIEVLAVEAGRVVQASYDHDGFGVYVKVRHAWGESLYAHLANPGIWLGAPVGRGQVVGVSGNSGVSSGPHLHFGLRVNPYNVNDGYRGYCDPTPYLTEPGVDVLKRANPVEVPPPAAATVEEESVMGEFAWYQQAALRTWNPTADMMEDLVYLALALAGEAGELANKVKKAWRHGHPLDVEVLKEEGGDVLWHAAVMMARLGVDLKEMAEGNIEKLLERYPEGFSQERSRNRKEGG